MSSVFFTRKRSRRATGVLVVAGILLVVRGLTVALAPDRLDQPKEYSGVPSGVLINDSDVAPLQPPIPDTGAAISVKTLFSPLRFGLQSDRDSMPEATSKSPIRKSAPQAVQGAVDPVTLQPLGALPMGEPSAAPRKLDREPPSSELMPPPPHFKQSTPEPTKRVAPSLPRADAAIHLISTSGTVPMPTTLSGDNVYSAEGAGQTEKTLGVPGETFIYEVRAQNDRPRVARLALHMPPPRRGWTVRAFDQLTGGQDVTAQILRVAGWRTPLLAPGASRSVRLEITAPTQYASGVDLAGTTCLIQAREANSPLGRSEDAVQANVQLQSSAGVQYTLDSGSTWRNVPTDGRAIPLKTRSMLGLRSLKSNPKVGWPLEQPLWQRDGQSFGLDEFSLSYEDDQLGPHVINFSVGAAKPLKIRIQVQKSED